MYPQPPFYIVRCGNHLNQMYLTCTGRWSWGDMRCEARFPTPEDAKRAFLSRRSGPPLINPVVVEITGKQRPSISGIPMYQIRLPRY